MVSKEECPMKISSSDKVSKSYGKEENVSLGEHVNIVNFPQKQKGEAESLTKVKYESKPEPKIEPIIREVVNHLSKIKVDTLDNIHLVLEKKNINIPKEDLLKVIKKYAEQGLFMVTEKALEGKRIVLVRLLRR